MRSLPHRLEKRSMGQAFSMRRFLAALFLTAMIPYVVTLAWTGRLDSEDMAGMSELFGLPEDTGNPKAAGLGEESERTPALGKIPASEPVVLLSRGGREYKVSAEECLPSLLAGQIPKDYGEETKKAQAVLLRTGLCLLADESGRIQENQLYERGIEFMDRGELEQLWGETEFASSYGAMLEAVQATKGEVAAYSGAFEDGLIYPFYCRAAAGKTRTLGEAYPYLRQAESPGDLKADGFLTILTISPGELAERISALPDAAPVSGEELLETLQIVERDEAGYVLQIQAGAKTYGGEEIREALRFPSDCYEFSEYDGKLQAVCRGIGDGYGFSQAGANELEKEGTLYQELLSHYFQNVEILKIWE